MLIHGLDLAPSPVVKKDALAVTAMSQRTQEKYVRRTRRLISRQPGPVAIDDEEALLTSLLYRMNEINFAEILAKDSGQATVPGSSPRPTMLSSSGKVTRNA